MSKMNRRNVVKAVGRAGLALGTPVGMLGSSPRAKAASGEKPRFLLCITGWGGASMIDAFMAFSDVEVKAAAKAKGMSATAAADLANTLVCYPESLLSKVEGTPFRAPKLVDYNSGSGLMNLDPFAIFAKEFGADMLLVPYEASSVTHEFAQRRSVNGNEAWDGRTIQEAVATQFGHNFAVPNLAMGGGGFVRAGKDATIPSYALPAVPSDTLTWPLSLDGIRGLSGVPSRSLIERARAIREGLDAKSSFGGKFANHPRLARWLQQRQVDVPNLERQDALSKLIFWDKAEGKNGINPDVEQNKALFELFPYWNSGDSLHTQAVLGLKALTSGLSCSVTLGLSLSEETVIDPVTGESVLVNLGIGFDASHGDHPLGQFFGWNRILDTLTRAIRFLKSTPYDSEESYWDRTVVYFAQDFGREKIRAPGAVSFGSGHHVNNAALLISPFAQGNKILGGVDQTSGMTYGTDKDGKAEPSAKPLSEKELFAGIIQMLGVDDSRKALEDPSWPDLRRKMVKSV